MTLEEKTQRTDLEGRVERGGAPVDESTTPRARANDAVDCFHIVEQSRRTASRKPVVIIRVGLEESDRVHSISLCVMTRWDSCEVEQRPAAART